MIASAHCSIVAIDTPFPIAASSSNPTFEPYHRGRVGVASPFLDGRVTNAGAAKRGTHVDRDNLCGGFAFDQVARSNASVASCTNGFGEGCRCTVVAGERALVEEDVVHEDEVKAIARRRQMIAAMLTFIDAPVVIDGPIRRTKAGSVPGGEMV